MLQAVGSPVSGRAAVSISRARGISDQPNSGAPMLTEIAPVDVRSQVSRPRLVRSAIDVTFASRINISATPRVALPHASSVEPSAFQRHACCGVLTVEYHCELIETD